MNVLAIISDQHAATCLGVAGHPQAITPHLDRLAREGVRFTGASTQNPICTPSRVSILSGQYDLVNDPDETRNLFTEQPVVVAECRRRWLDWLLKTTRVKTMWPTLTHDDWNRPSTGPPPTARWPTVTIPSHWRDGRNWG